MTFEGWLLDDVVLPNARVRQGDLVRFDGATDVLRKLGIVVTADCDLENKKHARILTLVPVVPATVIIEHYLIPDDCEKKKSSIESHVFKKLSISGEHDSITSYALLRDKLAQIDNKQQASLKLAVDFLLNEVHSLNLSEYNLMMFEIKSNAKKIDSLKEQLRNRGDLLILPDAPELGIKGHIAWVRQLWQTSASDVALRTSELASRHGERIARLDSPYRYRLTQLIAQVFSDIGLPKMPDSIDKLLDEAYC
jgi:hypothetical protein